jgi:hypothetical protein
MKTSRYFDLQVKRNRPEIKIEWCEEVVANPEQAEQQGNGFFRMVAWIPEANHYLRVITEPDKETLHNAFFDRSYARKRGKK